MVEPAFLGSGLNCGCEFPGSDSVFAAGELVCVVVVVALESDFAGRRIEVGWPTRKLGLRPGTGGTGAWSVRVRASLRNRRKSE